MPPTFLDRFRASVATGNSQDNRNTLHKKKGKKLVSHNFLSAGSVVDASVLENYTASSYSYLVTGNNEY